MVGNLVGAAVGVLVGDIVGAEVGDFVGLTVGALVRPQVPHASLHTSLAGP